MAFTTVKVSSLLLLTLQQIDGTENLYLADTGFAAKLTMKHVIDELKNDREEFEKLFYIFDDIPHSYLLEYSPPCFDGDFITTGLQTEWVSGGEVEEGHKSWSMHIGTNYGIKASSAEYAAVSFHTNDDYLMLVDFKSKQGTSSQQNGYMTMLYRDDVYGSTSKTFCLFNGSKSNLVKTSLNGRPFVVIPPNQVVAMFTNQVQTMDTTVGTLTNVDGKVITKTRSLYPASKERSLSICELDESMYNNLYPFFGYDVKNEYD